MNRPVAAAALLTIDGAAVAGDSGTYPVHDPGRPTEVVLEAPAASPDQLDRAVRSAARAQPAWAALTLDERVERVQAAAMAAAETADLATLLSRENGKVLAEASFELATIAAVAQTFGGLAAEALAPRRSPGGGEVRAEAHGVVAVLLPFNWPVSVLLSKVAPALVAGNAVVVKPPPTCPGAVLAVAQAMAAALPQGLLATVNGPGVEVGRALVEHADVAMVSLTGGVRTGVAVLHAAADRLVPVLAELGGNDAAIVAPDVEP